MAGQFSWGPTLIWEGARCAHGHDARRSPANPPAVPSLPRPGLVRPLCPECHGLCSVLGWGLSGAGDGVRDSPAQELQGQHPAGSQPPFRSSSLSQAPTDAVDGECGQHEEAGPHPPDPLIHSNSYHWPQMPTDCPSHGCSEMSNALCGFSRDL